MKILVLNYEYPPVGGGGGRVSRDVAEALAARGHQVMVVTSLHGDLPREETVGGVTIHRLPCLRRHADRCSIPEMAAYVLMTAGPTLKIAQAFAPDVIHAHFAVPTGLLARRIGRKLGVPYVITAHLGDVPGGVPGTEGAFKLADPIARRIWKDAAATTAVSRFVRTLAQTAYGLVPKVIPNGIDPARITATVRPPHRPVRLLFLGRFAEQKNPLLVLKAVWRLQGQPWQLDMVGDGPLFLKASQAVVENGMKGQVTLHGWLEEAAVDVFVGNADILIMPSQTEGLPMAGLQALAAGVAIVGSDAVADLVKHGENGAIVPTDAKSLGDALAKLIADPEALAAAKAASLARAQAFVLPAVVDAYETLLTDAAGKRQAAG